MKTDSRYDNSTLVAAQQARQSILDWLWANGPATFAVMIADMEAKAAVNRQSLCGMTTNMVEKGELAYTGPAKQRTFIAVARVTESAESIRHRKNERHRKYIASNPRDRRTDEAKAAAATKAAGMDAEDTHRAKLKAEAARRGVTLHFAGDTPQSRESRGQGAVRERVYINCAMPI